MATVDIPGDLLQTYDSRGRTHLKFYRMMAEILDQIDPGIYRKYITIDGKVRKIMYAECLNAIYGTLNAALLF